MSSDVDKTKYVVFVTVAEVAYDNNGAVDGELLISTSPPLEKDIHGDELLYLIGREGDVRVGELIVVRRTNSMSICHDGSALWELVEDNSDEDVD